ncbi:hypothetical protein [Bacillus thuringiensis]|uniref:hypothetical protein n=1 Tax=Bacillus thuringiensis TaxID=1428 RepID=UPI0025403C55|nr:hypothetical protein [Bacillus thuringiensis]WIG14992.1 hypothetical protein QOM09_13185 [Bacillus thuringiensis]
MRKLDRFTKPYFETRGEKSIYEVFTYKGDKPLPFKERFKSLKEARMFIYQYVHNNPEWLNENGNISELNYKDDRKRNPWYDNVIEQVYKVLYKDFPKWNK